MELNPQEFEEIILKFDKILREDQTLRDFEIQNITFSPRTPETRAATALIEILTDCDNPLLRVSAAKSLIQMNRNSGVAYSVLIEAANNPSQPDVQAAAVAALGELGRCNLPEAYAHRLSTDTDQPELAYQSINCGWQCCRSGTYSFQCGYICKCGTQCC